jgi:hypothetical protein
VDEITGSSGRMEWGRVIFRGIRVAIVFCKQTYDSWEGKKAQLQNMDNKSNAGHGICPRPVCVEN